MNAKDIEVGKTYMHRTHGEVKITNRLVFGDNEPVFTYMYIKDSNECYGIESASKFSPNKSEETPKLEEGKIYEHEKYGYVMFGNTFMVDDIQYVQFVCRNSCNVKTKFQSVADFMKHIKEKKQEQVVAGKVYTWSDTKLEHLICEAARKVYFATNIGGKISLFNVKTGHYLLTGGNYTRLIKVADSLEEYYKNVLVEPSTKEPKQTAKSNTIEAIRFYRPQNITTGHPESCKGVTAIFTIDYENKSWTAKVSVCNGDNFNKRVGVMIATEGHHMYIGNLDPNRDLYGMLMECLYHKETMSLFDKLLYNQLRRV